MSALATPEQARLINLLSAHPEGSGTAPDPIPMLLDCPRCGQPHIDKPAPERGWFDPPHKSHECQHCSYVWRPCDLPTRGVAAIKTCGKFDRDPRSRLPRAIRLLQKTVNRFELLLGRFRACPASPHQHELSIDETQGFIEETKVFTQEQ